MTQFAAKAVFLSYASQDAEAARRICEALRSVGVDVWFDQEGGLEQGDEWDVKIRRQIKECTLFIPIISANTQARDEGYFRIEWDLAAERARGVASGVPFMLPVVIDDTAESEALVPERFRAVQWTRLRDGVMPSGVQARFLKLWSHRTGVLRSEAATTSAAMEPPANIAPYKSVRKRGAQVYALAGIAVVSLLALAAWWFAQRRAIKPAGTATAAALNGPAAATVAAPSGDSAFPRDPELRQAWEILTNSIGATTEDFALAEDMVKGVLAKRPTDPETVIVYAWLNDFYINRGFDTSEDRYVLGQRYTERAVQLAPDDPEAMAARGQFLSFRGADPARAEQLLRRAIELNPREPRFHRALAYNVLRYVRPKEAIAVAENSAELFPSDPLVQYEVAVLYRDALRFDDMERALDRTLALAPIGAAIIFKSWMAGFVHGDVAGMKRLLDQIPSSERLTPRALVVRYEYARFSQQPDALAEALRALTAYPGPDLRDFWYTGPKATLMGDLYAAQKQRELAKGQFAAALAELALEKAAMPSDEDILRSETWALIGLGRLEDARADIRILVGELRAEHQEPFFGSWWFNPIPASLLVGDRETALELIKIYAVRKDGRKLMRVALAIDPRMVPFRNDPEIVSLIADSK
jgi:tetratricopeptide (TPR) repeat protein